MNNAQLSSKRLVRLAFAISLYCFLGLILLNLQSRRLRVSEGDVSGYAMTYGWPLPFRASRDLGGLEQHGDDVLFGWKYGNLAVDVGCLSVPLLFLFVLIFRIAGLLVSFQIDLRILLVVSLVAGGLLYLNLIPKAENGLYEYGWPNLSYRTIDPSHQTAKAVLGLHVWPLVGNIIVGFGILLSGPILRWVLYVRQR